MSLLKKIFGGGNTSPVDESDAISLHEEISALEKLHESEPNNISYQQKLLIKYTQAVSVYSQAPSFITQVDSVFTRMNELRNAARKNF
ncbi:hypothetical protein [Vibrio sp. ABG19]|uniref:hypothetical protein n=1 Tax=Vibrio sp. ABG19 TaxID=2817385 RepID=UPI00249E3593|nr:hypothetical protein [Vibrio sp. ABG19]WGY47656.1 hypothetical protein J0X00_08415 [Vibrio sp. ABG19]